MSNVQHSSKSNNYGTPIAIVESAKAVMGGIDLDPASSKCFNKRVGASKIFTEKDDGMRKKWKGRVFLNPPGGKVDADGNPLKPKPGKKGVGFGYSSSAFWLYKLIDQYSKGNVKQAVFVCFSVETIQSIQSNSTLEGFIICFPDHRLEFEDEKTGVPQKGPTHSNAIIGIGVDHDAFKKEFSKHGACAVFV